MAITDRDIAGLDALETPLDTGRQSRGAALWAAAWPKLAAAGLGVGVWQAVVWTGWKPTYVLPGPVPVLRHLASDVADGSLLRSSLITLQRAALGFLFATLMGALVGSVVARVRVLRTAFGSLITGLQTMPSIAWFPLAILLFGLTERAIFFVVVLGAAPAIANGLIAGADHVPPLLLRAGRVLGARGITLYRHVVLPASLPWFVAGLKQGWAFAWRSLMAGELLVIIANKQSIGVRLQVARDLADAEALLATMVLILVIGIVVDAVVFGTLERAIRHRWGLVEQT
ncbi:MAG TPA: ABC transporter permease [Acidimicrobiales bacterium]|nr:ABC transporter permease [Acidimicrobiales bacterium]